MGKELRCGDLVPGLREGHSRERRIRGDEPGVGARHERPQADRDAGARRESQECRPGFVAA